MKYSIEGTTQEELLESFQSCMEKLQSEITNQILHANSNGDVSRANELSVKLTRDSQVLVENYRSKLTILLSEQDDLTKSIYKFPCKVDLDLTVYDGDRDYLLEFNTDPNIQKALKDYEEKVGMYNSRKNLLKSSLKLTQTMAPNIYAIGNKLKSTLGINSNIEFYVYQENRFNASVYPPREDNIYIMLSSSLLEKFKDDELTFVIGHELGHALFDHHKYNVNAILDIGKSYLSPLHAIKLFSWGRSAEISADRIGLVCCESFVAAARAFFKLSSGVTSDSLAFQLDEYIKQFVDLSAELADEQVSPEDWYSTHPFSPLRIKALELFSRSKTYSDLINKEIEWNYTEEEMETEISQFMSLMGKRSIIPPVLSKSFFC